MITAQKFFDIAYVAFAATCIAACFALLLWLNWLLWSQLFGFN